MNIDTKRILFDTSLFLGPLLSFEVMLCWIWRPLTTLPGITSYCLHVTLAEGRGRLPTTTPPESGELAKKFPMSKSRSPACSEGTPPLSLGNRPGGVGGGGGEEEEEEEDIGSGATRDGWNAEMISPTD